MKKMEKGALIVGLYRYQLWRIWDRSKPFVLYIMLNPSTADADVNDNTIKRCISFAKSHGYGGFYVGNLFPFRSRDPKELRSWFNRNRKIIDSLFKVLNPNVDYIHEMKEKCQDVVFAWGNNGQYYPAEVKRYIIKYPHAKCFGQTGIGMPVHPLMQPGSQRLVDFKYNINSRP